MKQTHILEPKNDGLTAQNIGDAWMQAQNHVLNYGKAVDNELIESLNYFFRTEVNGDIDAIIARYAKLENIEEMRKVFHTTSPNKFGHSYLEKMFGPTKGDSVKSIISMLAADPATKRAVITLNGSLKGNVPCLNVIQFLGREETLYVNYFARGQDMYNKFYADAVCVSEISRRVGDELNFNHIVLSGTIGSAHIYMSDVSQSKAVVSECRKHFEENL